MGKRYYSGVAGMHDQFGPVVSSTMKKAVASKQENTPSIGSAIAIMLVGLPVLPIWALFMLIGESSKLNHMKEGTKEYEQTSNNVGFATIALVVGVILYSFAASYIRGHLY